jgi:HK97 gp10 family phage protein
MLEIKTEGFAGALEAMSSLNLDLQRKILKKALATAAAPVVFREKQNARRNRDSGLLADSIFVTVKVDKAGEATANIRPSGKLVVVMQTEPDGTKRQVRTRASAYAHVVEFGSKHVSARPFARPALAESMSEIEAGFAAEVNAAVIKATAKANRAAKK